MIAGSGIDGDEVAREPAVHLDGSVSWSSHYNWIGCKGKTQDSFIHRGSYPNSLYEGPNFWPEFTKARKRIITPETGGRNPECSHRKEDGKKQRSVPQALIRSRISQSISKD